MSTGKIVKISGPLVVAQGMYDANMFDVVRVGNQRLIGEIIEIHGDRASIQVYEETSGLGPDTLVETTGNPLSVELGPGLIETIYDGIQRPLVEIMEISGANIDRGVEAPALSRVKKWKFTPTVQKGDKVAAGDIIGSVPETSVVLHKIMAPNGISGTIESVAAEGEYVVTDVIAVIKSDDGKNTELTMIQKWPVRVGRPYKGKIPPHIPLGTGQRVIDTMFTLAKGGTACVPGPFGSGKTVVQHQIAKWSDVDIVIYVGCGERGNEMTDVLHEFPQLKDPRSGESLMKRTVLIANTSDMPVAAREASVYTGITIAEYFRDMGYDVAVIADSTSRWAEALREMSGRLEEMPGEEGYPAYLGTRIAQFYERAGRVYCACSSATRIGSLTAIGAVSPQGGDLSEPVSQSTMRIVKVFWGLDSSLAYRRHFPAINWLNSYSLYQDNLKPWFDEMIGRSFARQRDKAMILLQEEASLEEIVRLVGQDSLSPQDRLTLESARMIREDFLQQNAFSGNDSFSSFDRQDKLLGLILMYDELCRSAIAKQVPLQQLFDIPVRERLGRAKSVPEDEYKDTYIDIQREMEEQIEAVIAEEVDEND